jgi:hypothetical protein
VFAIANGIKIRGLNADCDRLAVQSSEQTTWLLGRGSMGRGPRGKWLEIGIQQNELLVLRPYGGCPEIEIECLGTKGGLLVVDSTQQFTRNLTVGQRMAWQLKRDEAVVIRCQNIRYPMTPGVELVRAGLPA